MQQARPRPLAHRLTSIYTCATCEYRQALGRYTKHYNTESISKTKRSDAIENRGTHRSQGSRRDFGRSHASKSYEPVVSNHGTLQESPEYNFSIRPKEVKSSHGSQIRQSLRAWSFRNETIKQEDAPNDLPYEGRLTQIPDSLFLGSESRFEEDNDNDGLSEENVPDDHFDNQSLYRSGHAIRPGTLIKVKTSFAPRQDAVYLGDIGTQSLLLLSDGRWVAEKILQKRVAVSKIRGYPVPEFLTSGEIEALREHMPAQDVTRRLGETITPQPVAVSGAVPEETAAPMLAKMRMFQESQQRFIRIHKAQLEQMYEQLAHEDKWRVLPMKDVPPLVLGVDFDSMTDVAKRAFVSFAADFNPFFVNTQTADTISYCIAPKTMHKNVELVKEWARLYQEAAAQAALGKNVSNLLKSNPLSTFIDKARRVIMQSRKIRSPTSMGLVGPSIRDKSFPTMQKLPSGTSWTPDEHRIIDYMYVISMHRPRPELARAHASLIARAIGAYPNMVLDDKTFRLLLQEIGCIDPWTLSEDLNVPLSGHVASWEIDQNWHEAEKSILEITDPETAATQFTDTFAHSRTDWGEMEAYCIDDSRSINREDALSIEPDTETSGRFWLHVHIVHASAHLDPGHPVMHSAKQRGAAYYSVVKGEPTQQIFPNQIIRQFGLRQNTPNPVLTISTLLATDGSVHGIKVAPGSIRNLKMLDRDAVLQATGASTTVNDAILVLGEVNPSEISFETVSSERQRQHVHYASKFLSKLTLMKDLLNARRERRTQEVKTPARFKRTSVSASVTVTLPEKYRSDRTSQSYHWKGDPTIVVRGNRAVPESETFDQHRADDVVAQAMRLGAESLGKWLSDRNIPCLFLGNDTPTLSVQELNEKTASTEISTPLFTRTTFPRVLLPHNMRQYVGCTSPLRRFSDMMVHLQTDSYLKAEARGIIREGSSMENDTHLAFSKQDLEHFLGCEAYASDALDDFDRESKKFWVLHALFRAFHFKEASLPETFEMLVQKPARRSALGLIERTGGTLIPWGLPIYLDPSPAEYEQGAGYHDFLPVKLLTVDPVAGAVTACATGPPTRRQQMVEPLMCLPAENFLKARSSIVQSGT